MLTPQAQIQAWAAELLGRSFVVLDTETTGLSRDAEIVQVAVVDPTGAALLDTLVRPLRPIPPEATAIHGISNDQVAAAPPFAEVAALITAALAGREVVIYNADYDVRVLRTSLALAGSPAGAFARAAPDGPSLLFGARAWHCAMRAYAQYVGQWSAARRSYRWQPLPGGDHSALGDARATLRLIRRMAGKEEG